MDSFRKSLILFAILNAYLCNDFSTAPKFIPRPNWGVTFSLVGTMLNGVTKYRHTFAIPWPKIEQVNLKPFPCDKNILYQEDCNRINIVIDEVNARLKNQTQRIAKKLKIEEENMNYVSFNDPSTRKKRETGHVLGNNYCNELSSNDYDDSDKSILGTIGKVASDLLGSPTSDDIKAIASHICNVAKLVELSKKEIHSSNDRLSSMSNVINERMTNLKSGIQDAENEMSKLNIQFNKAVENIDYAFKEIQERINKIQGMIAVELQLQTGLNRLETMLDILESEIDSWIFALGTLTEGYLPSFLVSREDIMNVLDHIDRKVLPQYGSHFEITHHNPSFYYELPQSIAYTKTDKYLMIMVKIPIESVGGILDVYKIDTTYVSISGNNSASTLIEHLPEFFATTYDTEYYTEFNDAYYSSCKGELIKICTSERSLTRSTEKSCAASLFFDSANDIMSKCNIAFEQVNSKLESTDYSLKINDTHYFVHSASPNEPWQLICSRATVGYNVQNIESCNSCIVQVPCFCELHTPKFRTPEQVSDCDIKDPNYPEITYHYGINLPMIHSLFNKTALTEIKGDILKENKRWEIQLPDLPVLNSSNWENVVQKDKKYESDFKKIIHQHKQKSKAFATKADYLLKKAEDFSDLSHGNLKEIKKLLGGNWLSPFLNPNVMLSGVSISTIISIVAIIFSIYTCCMSIKRS